MELKDMILSTLAELEEDVETEEKKESKKDEISSKKGSVEPKVEEENRLVSEMDFYKNLREKILVLFEGFQSPNNKNLEAKIDLTLNFLEYLLATLDERLEALKQKSK